MTLQDIKTLCASESEKRLNTAVFMAIQSGMLTLGDFLEYQARTQGDICDCLLDEDATYGDL